jgi:hypothetical protein
VERHLLPGVVAGRSACDRFPLVLFLSCYSPNLRLGVGTVTSEYFRESTRASLPPHAAHSG